MVEDLNTPQSTDDVQRQLDRLLRVEPSPEFVTRVRIHVATEAMSAPWWNVSRMAAAAAGVAFGTLLAAGLAMIGPGDLPAAPQAPTSAYGTGSLETPAIPAGFDVPRAMVSSVRSCGPSDRPCDSTSPRFEVIVSSAEVEGLRLLMATLRDGVSVPEVPATAGELTIEPLTIAQLAPDLELQ